MTLAEHASLCVRIFRFLHGGGGIPTDWLARQIARIDRTDGDIDALSKRLAYIRTWTYVAQRRAWVDDADHWRDETRAVEDRLSDALHVQLTQRFVDRRTSVLMRRLKQRESLVATVTENGEVRSTTSSSAGSRGSASGSTRPPTPTRPARCAPPASRRWRRRCRLRADKFYNAPDTEIDVTEQGGLMWGEYAVGKLVAGADALSPQVQPFVDEDADPEIAEKVRRRLGHWIDRQIAALFQPLIALRDDETLTGMARGIAFRLVEALGVMPRSEIAEEVKGLDQESRASLRKHGVRFGQYTVFLPLLLKPAPTRLRLVLWSLAEDFDGLPRVAAAGPRDRRRGAGRAAGLLSARRLPARRRAGDPHRHAGAARRHDPQPRRPRRLRGGPGDAVDHRPVARAVRQADAGHGLRRDRGHPAEAQAPAAPPRRPRPPAPAAAGDAGAGRAASRRSRCPDRARRAGAAARGGAPPRPTCPTMPGPASRRSVPAAPEPAARCPACRAAGRPAASTRRPAAAPPETAAEPRPDEPQETEVFYLFTRGQRRRPERAERPAASASRARKRGQAQAAPRRGGRQGKPRHRRRRQPQAARPSARSSRRRRRPPRPEKPIDPDNPFAALMALKLRS